jgi:hypothetical protein
MVAYVSSSAYLAVVETNSTSALGRALFLRFGAGVLLLLGEQSIPLSLRFVAGVLLLLSALLFLFK